MATIGRPKRKRKPGARTGVKVKSHTRTPRGPNTKGGKKKRPVVVDPYQRGVPTTSAQKNAGKSKGPRKRRKRKTRR